jgi:hypothetical protein
LHTKYLDAKKNITETEDIDAATASEDAYKRKINFARMEARWKEEDKKGPTSIDSSKISAKDKKALQEYNNLLVVRQKIMTNIATIGREINFLEGK